MGERLPHVEFSKRIVATRAGGVAAIHAMLTQLGFPGLLNERLNLLKRKLPYHESDHVLAMAYNILAGGHCLQDLDHVREDEAFLDMLGARRLPDPTTAGDFLRRFAVADVEALMDATNEVRTKIWLQQPEAFRQLAILDVDGTVTATTGAKKEDMAWNKPKATWGYAPLLISLANTAEPLWMVNRPGNATSHRDAARHIDRAIAVVKPVFERVLLRGDTAFSLTTNFDRWTEAGVHFVFGYSAHANLTTLAESVEENAWQPFERTPQRPSAKKRSKRENAQLKYVESMGWQNLVLEREDIAEVSYQPSKCRRAYRLIILRKTIRVEVGQPRLFGDETRYFFYITNDPDLSVREVVRHSNERCDQENLIEQLKNGVHALKAPVHDLVSNWAYLVVASLAWSFKAWFGLLQPRQADRHLVRGMKFRRFLNHLMLVPSQVLVKGRRLIVRTLALTRHIRLLFANLRAPLAAT